MSNPICKKYYYFEKPKISRELQSNAINHNEFQGIERGEWRKYNPYNPYVPKEDKQKQEENLKIDSLDDLFEEPTENKREEVLTSVKEDAPVLPQEKINNKPGSAEISKEEQEEMDLQKELEAKFDELFGPIDEE